MEVKGLVMIPSVKFAFGNAQYAAQEVSMQVKEVIIRLKKQTERFRSG